MGIEYIALIVCAIIIIYLNWQNNKLVKAGRTAVTTMRMSTAVNVIDSATFAAVNKVVGKALKEGPDSPAAKELLDKLAIREDVHEVVTEVITGKITGEQASERIQRLHKKFLSSTNKE